MHSTGTHRLPLLLSAHTILHICQIYFTLPTHDKKFRVVIALFFGAILYTSMPQQVRGGKKIVCTILDMEIKITKHFVFFFFLPVTAKDDFMVLKIENIVTTF